MMMLSFSMRRKLRRPALLLMMLLAVVAAGRVFFWLVAEDQPTVAAAAKRQSGETEQERQQFLAGLGWAVDPEPVEILEVVIPREFDETYQHYNQIQEEQGFDLTRYRGKRCARYSYVVHNHPSGEEAVRLNLLVCSGKIIGGDVCSMGLNGFLHGLAYPAAVSEEPQSS